MHGRRPLELAFRVQLLVQPLREVTEHDGCPSQFLIFRGQAVDLIVRAL